MLVTGDLWLSIVLATILCFVGGAVLHMVLPFHRKDWGRLPDEDGVMASLRSSGVAAGNYMFPCPADPKAMADPAFQAKFAQGPSGVMTIMPPGPVKMGPALAKQFLFHLIVSGTIAYIAALAMDSGAAYMQVFRFTGTVALAAYVAAIFPEAIWYHHPGSYVWGKVVDGIVWSLLTAGSFAGFWPA